jgi:chemotaxis protein methyltransferase CheR
MDNGKEYVMSDKEFHVIAQCVHQLCGIVLKPEKKPMVNARLSRRLRHLSLNDYSQYIKYLNSEGSSDETSFFINALTTNLTKFFREAHHFEHLTKEVLPPLKNQNRVRIWSAGCSTGEEPYSIAMSVLESGIPHNHTKILATDIDTNVLNTGREGNYKDFGELPKEFGGKYFSFKNGLYSISQKPRSLVSFKQLNLLQHWPMKGPFDAIFCRNTVIYFDKPTQTTLFNRMADLLKPNGWLYIGHSENLYKICDRFELKGRTIYQRIA